MTRCIVCGKELPPRKKKFCGPECRRVFRDLEREDAKFALIREFGLEKEYRFCKRLWRFDLAHSGEKIALEIEGGYLSGRHMTVGGFRKDIEKYNVAALMGWTVLRATWDDVIDGTARRWLLAAFAGRGSQAEIQKMLEGMR